MATIEERVEALETAVGEINEQLTELIALITLRPTKQQIVELNETYDNQVQSLLTRMTTLETQMADLTGRLTKQGIAIKALQDKVL